jgi:hypothetical protein
MLLTASLCRLTDNEVKALISMVDFDDGDGNINFPEFATIVLFSELPIQTGDLNPKPKP